MDYRIEKARSDDLEAILNVMEPWNMHHVPSVEMDALDLSCFYVARTSSGKVIGAGGYKILSKEEGKTTLLGVYPEFQGLGIGKVLQTKRLEAMYDAGVKYVTTNADHPETIIWYKNISGMKWSDN